MKGSGLAYLEIVSGKLGEHCWRKRTKGLAILDPGVDKVRISRRSGEARMERFADAPRPSLKAALEPSDNAIFREVTGDAAEEALLRFELLELEPRPIQGAAHLLRAVGGTIKGMRHLELARSAKCQMMVPESAAEWRARVGSAGAAPHALDGSRYRARMRALATQLSATPPVHHEIARGDRRGSQMTGRRAAPHPQSLPAARAPRRDGGR